MVVRPKSHASQDVWGVGTDCAERLSKTLKRSEVCERTDVLLTKDGCDRSAMCPVAVEQREGQDVTQ